MISIFFFDFRGFRVISNCEDFEEFWGFRDFWGFRGFWDFQDFLDYGEFCGFQVFLDYWILWICKIFGPLEVHFLPVEDTFWVSILGPCDTALVGSRI